MLQREVYKDLSNQLDPNCYTADRGGHPVLLLVCHNTEGRGESNVGQDAATAQQRSDFEAQYLASNANQVSVHWVIGEEECGAPIYRVVPEAYTAYHCGGEPGFLSKWVNPDDGAVYGGYSLNQVAIGIELVGQHNEVVGPKQLASLQVLVRDIVSRFPELKKTGRVVAHAWLEADRQDGRNWVELAKQWIAELAVPSPLTDPNPVAPGLVVSPGMAGRAQEENDIIRTNEQYFTVQGQPTRELSMCWGDKRFYLWDSYTPPGTSPAIYSFSKTQLEAGSIEAAAILAGQPLDAGDTVLRLNRKSDNAAFRVASQTAFVLVEDGSVKRCSIYKKD